ncbi:MAG: nitronate monooxygenase, partial [Solirubrobacteraceae bacterium]
MTFDTAITRMLGCTIPIQQAGFGSSLNVKLAAAVTAAGGIGTLGAALASPDELSAALAEVRERTDGPIAVNFVAPFFDRVKHAGALKVAASDADLVELFYGDPDPDLVASIHAGGALAGWQVGSYDEARRAHEAGVDVVTLQGVEAGGHVRGTEALTPLLALAAETLTIPLIAAGGISGPRAMATALLAGAAGVRLGTRFVASVEADFHADYKAAVVKASQGDSVYSDRFEELWPDAPHRVLRSAIAAAERHPPNSVVGQMSAG